MQTTQANDIYRIEIWATPYSQALVADYDVYCLLVKLGYNVNRAEYFRDHDNPSIVPDRIFTGTEAQDIVNILDRHDVKFIVVPSPKPDFYKETWQQVNGIRINSYCSK